MQGVQPNPKATPATGAANTPKRDRLGWNRRSPYSHGARTTSDPATNRAMASTARPESRVMRTWLANRVRPTAVAVRPRRMKTVENPATNSPVSRATRPIWRRDPPVISATSNPVITDR